MALCIKWAKCWNFSFSISPSNEYSQLISFRVDWFDLLTVHGQEEKKVTEDEMVGWNHQLNGHEFEQALGDSEEQGSLAWCSPWGPGVGHDLATEQQQNNLQ